MFYNCTVASCWAGLILLETAAMIARLLSSLSSRCRCSYG